MLDPEDLVTYELCFPGAITGEAEVECPYCLELFTLRRQDPPRRWAWGVIDWPFSFEPLAGQRVG